MGIRARVAVSLAVGSVALLGMASSAVAKPGDLLVPEYDTDAVLRIKPATGAQTVISDSPLFGSPSDLALLPNGKLLVTDEQVASIFLVGPGSTTTSLVGDATLEEPYGTALYGNRALVLDYSFVSNLQGSLLAVNPRNGAIGPTFTGTEFYEDSLGVEVSSRSRILMADVDGARIVTVNPQSGAATPVASGAPLVGPFDVAAGPGNRLYVVDPDTNPPSIIQVGPAPGAKQTVVEFENTTNPIGIDLAPNGRIAYVADYQGAGAILRVNLRTDQVTEVTSGGNITGPGNVVVEPARCGGRFPTLVGFNGRDTLVGTPRPDVIAGLGGRDQIKGLGGRDQICGGGGADRLVGGPKRDRLLGGKGRDRCPGSRDRELSC